CYDPACPHGAVHDSGLNNPVLTCQGCGKNTCFIHHGPWHRRLTCSEYQRRIDPHYRRNNISEEEKDRNPEIYGKRCPFCRRRVYRIDGCRHMTCELLSRFCSCI